MFNLRQFLILVTHAAKHDRLSSVMVVGGGILVIAAVFSGSAETPFLSMIVCPRIFPGLTRKSTFLLTLRVAPEELNTPQRPLGAYGHVLLLCDQKQATSSIKHSTPELKPSSRHAHPLLSKLSGAILKYHERLL